MGCGGGQENGQAWMLVEVVAFVSGEIMTTE
jgi:hypothetical protein